MKLKDNKIFRAIIIPLCLIMSLFGRFIPAPEGLSQTGMGVIFIFISSLILWFSIGIDWPSLLCIFSIAILPDTNFNSIISGSFGSEVFVFLLFTFICSYALSKTAFIKRVAIGFVTNKLARKSGHWFIVMFLTSVLLLGLIMSPTVLFFIMLPILEEIFHITGIEKGDKVAKVLMMGLGFTVSISSGMTLIAHVFPTLAFTSAAKVITGLSTPSMLSYSAIAFPIGLVIYILMLLMFRIFIKADTSKLDNADVSALRASLPKMDKKEILSVIIFSIVVLLWIIPEFFVNCNVEAIKTFFSRIKGFKTVFPPMLGALAFFIIRIDHKPILEVGDAFKNGVPWGSLVMCAGTLALGSGINYGLADYLKSTLGSQLAGVSAVGLVIIFLLWALIQTNLSSNMTTATVVSTVAATIIAATPSLGVNSVVLILLIGMLSSFAFATPPSMPHIAIIGKGDYCNTKEVLAYGSLLMLISLGVAFAGYFYGNLIMR